MPSTLISSTCWKPVKSELGFVTSRTKVIRDSSTVCELPDRLWTLKNFHRPSLRTHACNESSCVKSACRWNTMSNCEPWMILYATGAWNRTNRRGTKTYIVQIQTASLWERIYVEILSLQWGKFCTIMSEKIQRTKKKNFYIRESLSDCCVGAIIFILGRTTPKTWMAIWAASNRWLSSSCTIAAVSKSHLQNLLQQLWLFICYWALVLYEHMSL